MEDHPNTNGRPIVSALEYNRHPPVVLHGAAAVAAMDIPALLRAKKSELKVLFYSLAGSRRAGCRSRNCATGC